MLELQQVSAGYGPVEALREVSLQVPTGSLVCVLGANGAGKSTTLKTVSGLVRPRRGRVLLDGEDITALPPHLRLRRGVAHCPEGRRVFTPLTVVDNLRLGGHSLSARDLAAGVERAVGLFPALEPLLGRRAGNLSGGEQQMLAIARSLMTRPRLLLLDEPSLGLAPLIIQQVFRTIEEVCRSGTSVLLVEQNVSQALKIANFGYVLVTGRVEMSGPAAELAGSARLRQAYLGE